MAEQIVSEDAERRVIKATSDDRQPGEPGYWESVRTEWKAGSAEANRQAILAAAAAAQVRLQQIIDAPTPPATAAGMTQVWNAVQDMAKAEKRLIRLAINDLSDSK